MRQDVRNGLALLFRHSLIESRNGPIHLPFREVAAEVPRKPELGSIQLHVPVVSLVDLVRIVEPAVVFGTLTVLMTAMACRFAVEVALAERRTGTGFDRRRVHRPFAVA